MNDDNNTIPLHSIPFHSHHPTTIVTAGTAAEKDGYWKNPYIIYARNGKTAKKIIRKKLKMGVNSIVLQCYTAIVPRERGQNPGTGKKNLKIVLDSNTRKCYNRVKKTENRNVQSFFKPDNNTSKCYNQTGGDETGKNQVTTALATNDIHVKYITSTETGEIIFEK